MKKKKTFGGITFSDSFKSTNTTESKGRYGARGQFLFSFCCYQNGNSETRASECQRKEVRGFLSYTP